MNDPAVEAARRAFCLLWPDQGDVEFDFLGKQKSWAILAAREVLTVAWPSIKQTVEGATLAHADILRNQTPHQGEHCGCVPYGTDAVERIAVAINDSIFLALFPREIRPGNSPLP